LLVLGGSGSHTARSPLPLGLAWDRPRDPHPHQRRHPNSAGRARCHPTSEPRHRQSTSVLTLVVGRWPARSQPSDRRPISLADDGRDPGCATIASRRARPRNPRGSQHLEDREQDLRADPIPLTTTAHPPVRWPPPSAGCHSTVSYTPARLRERGLLSRVAASRAVAGTARRRATAARCRDRRLHGWRVALDNGGRWRPPARCVASPQARATRPARATPCSSLASRSGATAPTVSISSPLRGA
jgi:hypothetical protein